MGIGTTNPIERLDVNGKIRMRNQTLVSDANDTVVTKGYLDQKLTGTKRYANEEEDKYVRIDILYTEFRNVGSIDTCDGNKGFYGGEGTQYKCRSNELRSCIDYYGRHKESRDDDNYYKVQVTCKAFYYLTGIE